MTLSDNIILAFDELRRRKVFRVGAAYLVAAWVVVESSSIILPAFQLPDWSVNLVIVLAMFGFPLALVLAWFFDITPTGLVRSHYRGDCETRAVQGVNIGALALMLIIASFLSYRLLLPAELGAKMTSASLSSPRPRLLTPTQARQPAAVAKEPRSIAVLPLVNLTGDPEHEYFSDGMTEELLNALAQVRGLRVAARTSSFAFKNTTQDVRTIGERLGVDTILEGSVRKSGDTFRIAVQLVDVENGYHIWSSTYDRNLEDVFAVQDEIARSVVGALELELLGSRGTGLVASAAPDDSAAYEDYLFGLHALNRRTEEGMQRAIDSFERAVRIDPTYAPAWSGIADAWIHLYSRGLTDFETARDGADAALQQAVRYGENLAEVQASLGLYKRILEGDMEGSELALRRAIDINPNYAMAHLWLAQTLGRRDRFRDAFAELERAEQIDPLHPAVNTGLAEHLFSMGRYEEAVQKLERVLSVEPGLRDPLVSLAEWSVAYGHLSDAMQWARQMSERHPDDPAAISYIATIYLQLGDFGRAHEHLDRARLLDPDNDFVFLNTCRYLFANGQYLDLAEIIDERRFTPADYSVNKRIKAWRGLAAIMLGEYELGANLLMEVLSGEAVPLGPAYEMYLLSYLALALQEQGEQDQAQAALDEALAVAARARGQGWRTPQLNYSIAAVYALQGRGPEAIGQLRTAVEAGYRNHGLVGNDPQFDDLEDSEDFRLLVARVGADLNRQRAEVLHQNEQLADASGDSGS